LGISFHQDSRFYDFFADWTISVFAFSCIHRDISFHDFVLLVGGGVGVEEGLIKKVGAIGRLFHPSALWTQSSIPIEPPMAEIKIPAKRAVKRRVAEALGEDEGIGGVRGWMVGNSTLR
jgi:hypothetical protein